MKLFFILFFLLQAGVTQAQNYNECEGYEDNDSIGFSCSVIDADTPVKLTFLVSKEPFKNAISANHFCRSRNLFPDSGQYRMSLIFNLPDTISGNSDAMLALLQANLMYARNASVDSSLVNWSQLNDEFLDQFQTVDNFVDSIVASGTPINTDPYFIRFGADIIALHITSIDFFGQIYNLDRNIMINRITAGMDVMPELNVICTNTSWEDLLEQSESK